MNVRLCEEKLLPKNHQLAIGLTDGRYLSFTVAMYGGIILHGGDYDNKYYIRSKTGEDLLAEEFDGVFRARLSESGKLTAKAFLATEQRFVGIGNGVLQDILFEARINPRRNINMLSDVERKGLLLAVKTVIAKMTQAGGRDTEKDLYGQQGGFRTAMSKNNVLGICPACGGRVVKEPYMGGSVYYCPECQKR